MPIEVGIWKIDGGITKVNFSPIESEKKLESILKEDLSIISEDLLLIGRQVRTDYGKYIDMLAIDQDGTIYVIELKKSKTPREVVAQALDYASWVQTLSYQHILNIFEGQNQCAFEEAFIEKFDVAVPEEINVAHQIIIVSSELDLETERIINYLSSNYEVPINVVFFRYFKQDKQEFITRSWLIDPTIVEERSTNPSKESKREKWNGQDFVVNFDDCQYRNWDDAIKYGFVSAGNGNWYSRTLKSLFVGARVFCMIPKHGYVAVGRVTQKSVPLKDAQIMLNGQIQKLVDLNLKAPNMTHDINDLENCEYVVTVDWIKTIRKDEAFWIKGLRANQNSAYKLTNQYTIEKVLEHFGLDDE